MHQCLAVPVLHEEKHRVNLSFYSHKHKCPQPYFLPCSPCAYRANRGR